MQQAYSNWCIQWGGLLPLRPIVAHIRNVDTHIRRSPYMTSIMPWIAAANKGQLSPLYYFPTVNQSCFNMSPQCIKRRTNTRETSPKKITLLVDLTRAFCKYWSQRKATAIVTLVSYLELCRVGGQGGKLRCGRLVPDVHGVTLPVRHGRVGRVLQQNGEVLGRRHYMRLLYLGRMTRSSLVCLTCVSIQSRRERNGRREGA